MDNKSTTKETLLEMKEKVEALMENALNKGMLEDYYKLFENYEKILSLSIKKWNH